MRYNGLLKYKIEITVGTAVIVLLLAGFLANRTISASRDNAKMVGRTYKVLATLDDLQASIAQMIATSRGYVLTRDTRFVEAAKKAAERARGDQMQVRQLTRDNPSQQKIMPELRRNVERSIRTAEQLLVLDASDAATTLDRDAKLERSGVALSQTLGRLKSHELGLLAMRFERSQTNFALSESLLLGGTFAGLVIAIFAGIGAARDHRKRMIVEEALFVEKERAQITLSSIGDGVISTDVSGQITFINHAATLLTGWSASDAVGRSFSEVFKIVDTGTRKPIANRMHMAVEYGRTVHLPDNAILVSRNGTETPIEDTATPIYGADGNISGAVKVFRDVSAVRELTERLHHWAQHDFLTGLPNRILFHDRLNQSLALARREKSKIAVLFLDLDGFKKVNDQYGHAVGDKLLQGVGLRIRQSLRESDTLCRLGGDEFVILLHKISSVEDAKRAGDRVLESFKSDVLVDGRPLSVSCSIGVAVFPDDTDSAEALIVCADAAMYSAKMRGRNMVSLFDEAAQQLPGPRQATA